MTIDSLRHVPKYWSGIRVKFYKGFHKPEGGGSQFGVPIRHCALLWHRKQNLDCSESVVRYQTPTLCIPRFATRII